jgi:hypothetical protein
MSPLTRLGFLLLLLTAASAEQIVEAPPEPTTAENYPPLFDSDSSSASAAYARVCNKTSYTDNISSFGGFNDPRPAPRTVSQRVLAADGEQATRPLNPLSVNELTASFGQLIAHDLGYVVNQGGEVAELVEFYE